MIILLILRLTGVSVRRSGRTILGPIDWSVGDGERWVVVGPNGSGKTTLVHVASTYLWPTTGSVEVLGEAIGKVMPAISGGASATRAPGWSRRSIRG